MVLTNPKLLADLLEGIRSSNGEFRYECFRAIYLISEDHPEVLYLKWDLFKEMLKSGNKAAVFQAVHILANLTKIDSEDKFKTTFIPFFEVLKGEDFIAASHLAYVSHKIVQAKPELVNDVVERLLNLNEARYKHVDLVQANALVSFSKFFDKITDKARVLSFVEDQRMNGCTKAKKEAALFLKKWKGK